MTAKELIALLQALPAEQQDAQMTINNENWGACLVEGVEFYERDDLGPAELEIVTHGTRFHSSGGESKSGSGS